MSENIQKNHEPIFRALGYSLTSALIMLASFFVNFLEISRLLVGFEYFLFIGGLWTLSWPFFYMYAYIYSYSDKQLEWSENRTIFILICIISGLLSLLLFAIYSMFSVNNVYTAPLIFLVVAQLVMVLLITYHYFRDRNSEKVTKYVRNRITIPILYSIGMSFLLPFSVKNILETQGIFNIFLPYIIFIVYLYVVFRYEEKMDKKSYQICNWISVATILIITILFYVYDYHGAETLKNILVSVAIAAFVASFESWRVTEYIVNQIPNRADDSLRKNAYYHATTLALCISVLVIPILLIFTEYFYMIFYILIVLIGVIACFIWFKHGIDNIDLLKRKCAIVKTIIGFLLLLIIVTDAYTKTPMPQGLLTFDEFFQFSSLFVVVGIFFYLLNALLNEYYDYQKQIIENSDKFVNETNRDKFKRILKIMINEPRNFNRLLGIGSFIPFLVIFMLDVIKFNDLTEYADVLLRMRATEIIYICISCFCIVFDVVQKMFNFRKDYMVLPTETLDVDTKTKTVSKICIKKVYGFIKLSRFFTSFAIELIVLIPCFIKTGEFLESVFYGIPFMLSAMVGFAINDVFDYRKDKINKPGRALPSNLLNIKQAKIISFVLGILSFISSLCIAETTIQLVLYLSALLGVLIYNGVVKYIAIAKTLCAALICILPIVFTTVLIDGFELSMYISICAFMYILGREIRMDILDFEGDVIDNIKTLPIVLGKNKAAQIAYVVILLPVIFSCLLILLYSKTVYALLFCVLIITSQLLCEMLWKNNKKILKKQSILLQWIPMLLTFLGSITI